MQTALHAARLAFLEAALLALLHEQDVPFDAPDTVSATFGPEGLDVEYRSNGVVIGGEGI